MKIIGDGGHAKVVRDIIGKAWGRMSDKAHVAIGDNAVRKKEAEQWSGTYHYPVILHWDTTVADSAVIGDGSLICARAVIGPNVKIGKHVIINDGAILTHDITVGDYAHIAPMACLCGGVTVGEGALVGAGSVAVPGAVIAPWSLVKARGVAK